MADRECWNCNEPLQENWNYCPYCRLPVDGQALLEKVISLDRRQRFLLQEAPHLFLIGLRETHSDEEIEVLINDLRTEDTDFDGELVDKLADFLRE